jgi:hypothetical protein
MHSKARGVPEADQLARTDDCGAEDIAARPLASPPGAEIRWHRHPAPNKEQQNE